uniref:Uncharacterized protein n=1 Tax=Cacopsylla melanoneura TaxID=428564 RepID=A0A8D8TFF9_9HEMI
MLAFTIYVHYLHVNKIKELIEEEEKSFDKVHHIICTLKALSDLIHSTLLPTAIVSGKLPRCDNRPILPYATRTNDKNKTTTDKMITKAHLPNQHGGCYQQQT